MDGNLPDWLKDTTASKQAPPPPVAEEPELLPAPSPKVLIKPALVAVLIILVIAASVSAFFLTQKKGEKFVIKKEAAPLDKIACPGGVKSDKINTTYGYSGTCRPEGTAIDRGSSSGLINVTYGFGDANPCTAASGKTQTYSIEIIKCTDDDKNRCKYGAYSEFEKGERITSSCQNLAVDASGKGQFAYNYTLPGPGCYQFDICPAGPDQSCYRAEGGVVFAFRTAFGIDECKEGPTPTLTPPDSVVCSTLTASNLSGLKTGDQITFTITTSGVGVVEAAAVRLIKGGVKVQDIVDTNGADGWSVLYDIPGDGAGNYEALGFVKVGGIWK